MRQLEDGEVIFTERDKKCSGLEIALNHDSTPSFGVWLCEPV